MPVDPQIQMLLDLGAALPPLQTLSVDDARAQFAARDFPGLRKPEVASVVNRDMQGPGGSLGLRIYTPPGQGPFPLMVFFHGSGFVLCSLDTHDGMCRNLCAGTRLRRGFGRLPSCPRGEIPRRDARLPCRNKLGGGERRSAGRRPWPRVRRR